jgi:hypothetical protein
MAIDLPASMDATDPDELNSRKFCETNDLRQLALESFTALSNSYVMAVLPMAPWCAMKLPAAPGCCLWAQIGVQ